MKRPPMKKTVTSAVASICDRRSCVRERMSRNVQIIRLSQNMIVKATIKPMTIPSEFVRVVKVLLPEDGGVAVETTVGAAVGVASGPIFRICAIYVIAGLMPLSEICIICYLQLQRTRSENGNTIGLIQAFVHGNAMRDKIFYCPASALQKQYARNSSCTYANMQRPILFTAPKKLLLWLLL